MQDFAFKPAHEIADAVRRRAVSPVETVEAALAAMSATEPRLHAFATPAPEQALADARALEQSLARGGAAGLLAGVPVAIKDLLFTKGLRTTFGSRLYADFVPERRRHRRRAAEGGGRHRHRQDQCRGVRLQRRRPQPAAAHDVQSLEPRGDARRIERGLGRRRRRRCLPAGRRQRRRRLGPPACGFTGLFGIKASMGRVPVWPGCRDPAWPGASGWESIEHIGPMARSVADAALMLQVMAGPDARDRWSLPADGTDWRDVARPVDRLGLRIAYCPQWEDVAVDPEVRALVDAAVAVFETLGCSVETLDAPVRGLVAARRAIISLESDITGMRKLAAGREAELSGPVRGLLSTNWQWGQFTDALTERKRCVEAMRRFMERYDLLLTPTAPLLPFAIDREGPGTIAGQPVEDDCWMPAMFPFNLTGQPAASVPAGWSAGGLPAGLQIVGRHLADATVLKAAAAFEQARPWAQRRPPVMA